MLTIRTVISLATYKCSEEWQPSWLNVGRHVHFAPRIEDITRSALRHAFGLGIDEEVPPFVAIHVRHGDFKDACYDWSIEECWAPLERYALRVEQVQAQLRDEHNVDAKFVLMTSDERNATWWEETEKLGWKRINYATQPNDEILGKWYVCLMVSSVLEFMLAIGIPLLLTPRRSPWRQASSALTGRLCPLSQHSAIMPGVMVLRGLLSGDGPMWIKTSRTKRTRKISQAA